MNTITHTAAYEATESDVLEACRTIGGRGSWCYHARNGAGEWTWQGSHSNDYDVGGANGIEIDDGRARRR